MDDVDVAVVGAGPAGLGAALEATRLGLGVSLIDSSPVAGGQVFARPGEAWGSDSHQTRGRRVWDRIDQDRLDLRLETDVWGVWPPTLALSSKAGHLMRARAIVIATGAIERPTPFPGWTMPGVVSGGLIQRMLKVDRAIPTGRVVVAGSGPFLFVVAAQLAGAGATVTAVVESRTRRALANALPELIISPERRTEAVRSLLTLRRRRASTIYGSVVTQALGHDSLERVVIAGCDQYGFAQEVRTFIPADVLVMSTGFIPSTQLAELAGCKTRLSEDGQPVVEVDETMATTVPGVFCAGQPTGVTGWDIALAKGRIAGLAASRLFDRPGTSDRLARLQKRLERLIETSTRQRAWLSPLPGWTSLVTDDTIVCRCERVTWGAARTAGAPELLETGPTDLKALTRCGMGPCQARLCDPILRALWPSRGVEGQWDGFTVRPPVTSVTVGQIADSNLLDLNQAAGDLNVQRTEQMS